MGNKIKRVRKVCANCGSDEVKVEAFAYWNEVTQDWDRTEIFPPAFFCDYCEKDDIEIRDVPLDSVPIEVAVARDDGTWNTVLIDVPYDVFTKYNEGLDISSDLISMIDGCVFASVYHIPSPGDNSFEESEPEDPDDRAPCVRCGRPISDAEHIDNQGYCNECCHDPQEES